MGGRAVGRRWLALFTVLLLAVSAVSVLAESSPAEDIYQPTESELEALPDASAVAKGLSESEEQEAAEQEKRETPAAVAEREESLEAFAEVSASEAKALLQTEFAEQLALIDQDPARMLSDATVEEVLTPTAARVSVDGNTMLVDGMTPVRAPDEEGDLHKVDLDLVADGEDLAAANPLTEVTLPDSSAEAVEIGSEGLAIEPVLTEPASASIAVGGEDVFYPETQTDTDLLVMPIERGVELFSQLRSIDSPEELRFELTLPGGTELVSDGEGGAKVAREGETVASVPSPTAVDAQGADIPVQMKVEGTELVLEVAHRSMDVAYPALVDPIVDEWYGNLSWFAGYNQSALTDGVTWVPTSNNWGRFKLDIKPIYTAFEGSGKGLFVSAANTAGNQAAYDYAQWNYTAPGATTWIKAAGVQPFWRHNMANCPASTYPKPHDYIGLWSPAWNGWTDYKSDWAQTYGYGISTAPKGWSEVISPVFVIGLGVGVYNTAPIPCWRDLYAGGVYIWLDDPELPTLSKVSGVPTGWFSDETKVTITASASDPGLGVQYVSLHPQGQAITKDVVGCTGLRASPCPAGRNSQFNVTGAIFGQGQRTASVYANDALTNASSSYVFESKVDLAPPEVTLSGQLAKATKEEGSQEVAPGEGDELGLPVYNLEIKATDGSNASNAEKRSGVKRIEVLLDKVKKQVWEKEACPEASCPMTQTYSLKLHEVSAGPHSLEVFAVDFVGKKRERKIEFEYVPATGMKDEYVMHYFPLPDGQGDESKEEFPDRPELAVNVMNGNLVYREKDVEIHGYGADLEVERYYNSMLPTAENSEWGDGWTLAQTPELTPLDTGGTPAPDEAELTDDSGGMDDGLDLPLEAGGEEFDPALQATITKEADGGFELADETGGSGTAIVFDPSGKTEQLRTEGYATVDYGYEAGELSEIAIEDPASASIPTEEPEPPSYQSTYSSSFGTLGTGNGQLKAPAGLALDAKGNIWVADKGNNRIQKFNEKGEYVSKFGTAGSGNGQFNQPTALDIDAKGNIWVADKGNNRVQKFNESGGFLSKFGSYGTGNGQFSSPEGIAIDAKGNIWVADTLNGRLQKFNESGAFLKVIASKGSAEGQLGEPSAIDIAPDGGVLVAEWQNNRVSKFSEGGEFVLQFGSAGSGNGQFDRPNAIAADTKGSVWVADQNNGRVQRFSGSGDYFARFGAKGSGAGQFGFARPMGLALGAKGSVWVADQNNNRIQKWSIPSYVPTTEENDPSVEIDVSNDLVSGLDGEEAGQHSYAHVGDDLVAHNGPQGETKYEYDSSGRLKKVTLANGTTASIAYNVTYGRVSSVAVKAAGASSAKTTYFAYTDEPRRTTVTPPGAPVITYDFGDDGSLLKSSNAKVPPDFDFLAGSLYEGRETANPISPGDHNLSVQAHSEHGIELIRVLTAGNVLVDEMTCEQDQEKIGTECVTVPNQWVTGTENHPPGILDLEVVIEDTLKQTASRRFWVNIPEPTPLTPGAPIPPRFAQVLQFREEHGLDIDLDPVADEIELHERIFDTIGDWWAGAPVARASMERWGAPLRNPEVAELEDRIADYAQAAEVLPVWAASTAPSTYAGYYVDEREGGVIHVGFTGEQNGAVANLIANGGLVGADRVAPFPSSPGHSLAQLETLESNVRNVTESLQTVTRVTSDVKINKVIVGATDPSAVSSYLTGQLGAQPLSIIYEPTPIDQVTAGEGVTPPSPRSRERVEGSVLGGDFITNEYFGYAGCTAGYGAWENGEKASNGQPVHRIFLLDVAHCFFPADIVERRNHELEDSSYIRRKFGATKRTGYEYPGGAEGHNAAGYNTDSAAIWVQDPWLAPRQIIDKNDVLTDVHSAVKSPPLGTLVCFSGQRSNAVVCGPVAYRPEVVRFGFPPPEYIDVPAQSHWVVCVKADSRVGDSGGPVWIEGTHKAVGLVSAGSKKEFCYMPLLSLPGIAGAPGALKAPGMGDLNLMTRNP